VTPYRQRVAGLPDCKVTIDGRYWRERLDDKSRLALADHELTHFELAKDGSGFVKSDKAGRPRVKMRAHDWELGGFNVVLQRHGLKSLDALTVLEAAREFREFRQLFLFEDTDGPATVTIALPGRETVTVGVEQLSLLGRATA
jgi:hypothetical protein